MDKRFTGENVGTNKIPMAARTKVVVPEKVYVKEDGGWDEEGNDTPSVCITFFDRAGSPYYAEMTVETWNKGLNEAGYKIEKL